MKAMATLGGRKVLFRIMAVGLVVAACGGSTGASQTGGESHFLRTCSSACGDGLECISGICTRGCVLGKDSCTDLDGEAECTDQSIETGAMVVCDVSCAGDGDCSSLGTAYRCQGGFCRSDRPLADGTGGKGNAGGASSGGKAAPDSTGATGNSGSGSATGGAPFSDGGAAPDSSAGSSTIVDGTGGVGGGAQSCRVLHQTYRSGTTGIVDPSGCGTCTCEDGGLSCTEPGCEIGPLVFPCPEDVVSDPISVGSYSIQGDKLVFQVDYGGGCGTHEYGVCYGESFEESYPVQGTLRLIHDAHEDDCERAMAATLEFDLRPYAELYNEAYLTEGGLIDTNYGMYAFGTLSCDERTQAAGAQLASALSQLNLTCETNDDCEWAYSSTDCSQSCGTMIATSEAARLEDAVDGINATVCTGFVEECGALLIHPCTPPGTVACVDGRCAETSP